MSLGGPVLRRELQRLSRRPSTWVTRVGAGALGFALLASARAVQGPVAVTDLSWTAHQIMSQLTFALVVLVGLVAPTTAAFAVEEERTEGTLDLLSITPMPTATLLWGKVASRLAQTLALVLGVLPVIGCMTSFGAIDPYQVLLLGVHLTLLGVLMAQVATCLTVGMGGSPLLAAVGAVVWFTLLAMPGAVARAIEPSFCIVPLYGMTRGDAWGLLPLVTMAPIVWGLGWVGPVLFRLTTGAEEDDELGLLSSELWRFRRVERHLLWTVPALPIVLALGAVLLVDLLDRDTLTTLAQAAVLAWTAAGGLTVPLVLLRIGRWGRTRAAGLRRAATTRREARGERRPIGRWPLTWRLLRTHAGGARSLARLVGALWLAFLPLAWLTDRREGLFIAGLAAWLGAMALAALHPLATTSLDTSWRQRDLLVLSGVRPGALVRSHVGGALLRTVPLALAGGLCVLYGLQRRDARQDLIIAAGLTALVPAACAWLAASSTAVGLLAPARTRWPLGLAVAMGLAFAPNLLDETLPAMPWSEALLEAWQPLLGSGRAWGGRGTTLAVATGFHLAMAMVVTSWTSLRLARRAGPPPASR